MLVTNGDVIRAMDNKNLAEFLYVLLEKIKKPYNDYVIQNIKEWLDSEMENNDETIY